nr:MAG TPA: Radical SAM superfamily [Caudoviricetes sp.]
MQTSGSERMSYIGTRCPNGCKYKSGDTKPISYL